MTLPSVKNFQLCDADDDPGRIVMQFGRVSGSAFTMDYSEPLTLVQATQIAMSTFDHKWAVK